MTRAFMLAPVVLLLACGGTQTSSESHWVRCGTTNECVALDAAAVCRAGYCEGPGGERYEQGSAVEPVESSNGGGLGSGGAGETGSGADGPSGGQAGNTNSAGAAPSASCPDDVDPVASPRTHEGDYVLTDATSLAAADGVTEVTGEFSTSSRAVDDLTVVSLPHLESIGGSLVLDSTSIAELVLPSLTRIGGNLSIRFNAPLLEVDLRRLETVEGTLTVTGNPALSRLRLDSLQSVLSLEIEGDALAGCEVEALLTRLPSQPGGVGNPDCECSSACGWLETQCR